VTAIDCIDMKQFHNSAISLREVKAYVKAAYVHAATHLTYIFHEMPCILVISSLPCFGEYEEIIHGYVALLLLVKHSEKQRDLAGEEKEHSGVLVMIGHFT
jgi:hypothetical protein